MNIPTTAEQNDLIAMIDGESWNRAYHNASRFFNDARREGKTFTVEESISSRIIYGMEQPQRAIELLKQWWAFPINQLLEVTKLRNEYLYANDSEYKRFFDEHINQLVSRELIMDIDTTTAEGIHQVANVIRSYMDRQEVCAYGADTRNYNASIYSYIEGYERITNNTMPKVVVDRLAELNIRNAAIRTEDDVVIYVLNSIDILRARSKKMSVSKFFTNVLKLDQEVIRDIQNERKTQGEIHWARTRKEIDMVYSTGPSSCMSYCIDDYDTNGTRPVEVYATPDLAVAYLKGFDGDIIARCVCNMNSKSYPTVYGHDALRTKLAAEGFHNDETALDGCRVLALYNEGGDIILPYIDGDNYAIDPNPFTQDGIEYFRIDINGSDDYSGDYETGLVKSADSYREECYDCCNRAVETSADGYAYCRSCYEERVCSDCDRVDCNCY